MAKEKASESGSEIVLSDAVIHEGEIVPPGKQRQPRLAKRTAQAVEEVDTALVAEAVADLNRLHAVKTLETALGIGQYLIDRFFDGNVETFRAKGGKVKSFRALAEHPELRFGHSYIWYSVEVVEQMEQLAPEIAKALPLSHHRLLLPVKDVDEKRALAKEAAEQGLTKREFEAKVKIFRKKEIHENRTGRPHLSGWAKNPGGLRAVVDAVLVVGEEGIEILEKQKGQTLADAEKRRAEVVEAIELLTQFLPRFDQAIEAAKSGGTEG